MVMVVQGRRDHDIRPMALYMYVPAVDVATKDTGIVPGFPKRPPAEGDIALTKSNLTRLLTRPITALLALAMTSKRHSLSR
jgi:hypothetical protein